MAKANSTGPAKNLVNGQGLEDLLRATIPAYRPVLITGMPGVGKTELVRKVCSDVGFRLLVSHPVIKNPTDYRGLPWLFKTEDGNGEAVFVPFEDLKAMITADVPTCVFFDDMGQAQKSVQAPLMQIIQERAIDGQAISDKVVFVAATNRKQDKAGVTGIIEPLKSRFTTIVEYEPEVDHWVDWAYGAGVDPALVAFIRFRPQFLTDFTPTADLTNSAVARTIENLDRLVKLNLPASCRYAAYVGAVGEGCASEWKAFQDIHSKLPSLSKIKTDPTYDDVPTDISVCYALIGALITQVDRKNIGNVYTYIGRLPFEYQALWHKDVTKMHPALIQTAAYVKWSADNGQNLV
jgi:hypothetical protein